MKIEFKRQDQFKFQQEGSEIVYMTAAPNKSGTSLPSWEVTWTATPTSIASNSWIGLYPYAQKSSSNNLHASFEVSKRTDGSDTLKPPREAGIYDIRFIQDNNEMAVASTGPYVINPSDIELSVSKTQTKLGEKIKVSWNIQKFSYIKLHTENTDTYLCLNIIGAYDDCLWKLNIHKNHSGTADVILPEFAGYYVVRIIIKYNSWKWQPNIECLGTSMLIKSSDHSFKLIPETLETIVTSNISTEWNVKKHGPYDWIGLFSLQTSDAFLKSAQPIHSKKVDANKGKFLELLPPNQQAGPFIFVYFHNHVPVSVSDIIDVQQPKVTCPSESENKTMSKIKHLVIICTENHSFDNYFGNYCTGDTNSNSTCTDGPSCCEKAPEQVQGQEPYLLDDAQNIKWDPNHNQDCELCEINGGRMDGYLKGCECSNPMNFAVSDYNTVGVLHDYASKFALADRYFQPNAGASSQNDMYLARAGHVFRDNAKIPVGSVGSNCWYLGHSKPEEITLYYDPVITSLLGKCGATLKSYAEGYETAKQSFENNPCYPNGFDPSDIPYDYYAGLTDKPKYIGDYKELKQDIINDTLPEVSFVKPLGINTAHPGYAKISDEINFIKETVDAVLNSKYAEDTLIVWVPDESGGYYDHIAPPQTNEVDGIPYGPRIPFLALGKFAKKNYISHVTMEHSSIVKFIEWNWLGGKTGQLNTRDKNVNSIGDLIDPIEAGIEVPN